MSPRVVKSLMSRVLLELWDVLAEPDWVVGVGRSFDQSSARDEGGLVSC